MNFELEYLWNIYHELTSTKASSKRKKNDNLEISEEIKRLRSTFLYFSPQTDATLLDYIRFHQRSICRIVKAIELSLQESKTLDAHSRSSLISLARSLNELLDFILFNYPSEFDYTANISLDWITQQKILQEKKAIPFFEKLEKINVNPDLKTILLKTLTLDDRPKFTYGNLRYLSDLTLELNNKIEVLNTEEDLKTLLSQQDFNNLQYYEYIRKGMSKEFESSVVISEKYRLLIMLKRELEQNISNTRGRYSPDQPPLNQMINKFLESERLFIKELDFLTTELVNSGLLDSTYKVSLTVKQLAFYVYLNVECGIITEQRAKKIHQYAIAHVDSYEKTGISEKSFKNAYYLHSAEDIRKVSDKIAKMLAIAQDKY